jgi:hypothetical protein
MDCQVGKWFCKLINETLPNLHRFGQRDMHKFAAADGICRLQATNDPAASRVVTTSKILCGNLDVHRNSPASIVKVPAPIESVGRLQLDFGG